MKSDKTISRENTAPDDPKYYLNEYHRKHSLAAMEQTLNQPWMSEKEACEQYDRVKAESQADSQSTLPKKRR